jgi:hypothetical protein
VFDEDNSGTISREELTKVLVHNRRRSRTQIVVPPPPLEPEGPRPQLVYSASGTPRYITTDMDHTVHTVREGGRAAFLSVPLQKD